MADIAGGDLAPGDEGVDGVEHVVPAALTARPAISSLSPNTWTSGVPITVIPAPSTVATIRPHSPGPVFSPGP